MADEGLSSYETGARSHALEFPKGTRARRRANARGTKPHPEGAGPGLSTPLSQRPTQAVQQHVNEVFTPARQGTP